MKCILFQVFIALRFYATGSFQREIGNLHGVHQTTVSRIVKHASEVIAPLSENYINFPQPEECDSIQRQFALVSGFPGVIGLIDGTHVRIVNPGKQSPLFALFVITVISFHISSHNFSFFLFPFFNHFSVRARICSRWREWGSLPQSEAVFFNQYTSYLRFQENDHRHCCSMAWEHARCANS